MDLHDSPVEAAFRTELRAWLAANAPQESEQDGGPASTVDSRFSDQHLWHHRLYEGGWLGLDWPAEYGGRGLTPLHQLIFNEELDACGAPPVANWVGLELVGPTLLRWGSPEQKQRYLPAILDGSEIWCQGFSEPEAGSDLAAVTTSATPDGTGWVINGHKRWTSWAQFSDHALVLARTEPDGSRHRGLSCFIVPIKAQGIRIDPIPMLYGDTEEVDLYLDEVRVGPDALLGSRGEGWSVVMHSLTHARGPATLPRIFALQGAFRRLANTVLERLPKTALTPSLHSVSQLVGLHAELEALQFLAYRKIGELVETGAPGQIASCEKLLWAELNTRIARAAVDFDGFAAITSRHGVLAGRNQREFYRALAGEIEGGTNEVQRTVIARHVLRLPC